jgi:hypothetical protein
VGPWADVTLGARAELMLASWIGVEVSGAMMVPITRRRWIFDTPELVVHETPAIGGYLTAGVRFVLAR